MIDRKEMPAVRIFAACTLAAYVAGEHLEYAKAPAKQALAISVVASTTAATSAVMFHPMTFAKIDPAPAVVPPGDRQEQG